MLKIEHLCRVLNKKRIGKVQLETLISYMEQHCLFARGQIMKLGVQGNKKAYNMWLKLSHNLNSIGPCKKNVDGWKEVSKISNNNFYRLNNISFYNK